MANEEKKKPMFEMEQEAKHPLSMYFFTIQKGMPQANELNVILAYTDGQAINSINKRFPDGHVFSISKKGELPIQKLLEVIRVDGKAVSPQDLDVKNKGMVIGEKIDKSAVKVKVEEYPLVTPPLKTKQQFVYDLMLVADRYVLDKKDVASLKRILKKVQIDEITGLPVAPDKGSKKSS